MMQTRERRGQPRVKGTTGFTVEFEPKTPAVEVKDISLSGIRFRTNRPIEDMTRLMMTLVFPDEPTSKGKEMAPDGVQCEGAVVRCDAIGKGSKTLYEIAVFFTQLSDDAKRAIEDYVYTHR